MDSTDIKRAEIVAKVVKMHEEKDKEKKRLLDEKKIKGRK